MPIEGFDEEFVDIRDYILKITFRIWEGRRMEAIRDYYGDPCPVNTPGSFSTDVESVVKGTVATLNQFPDRPLLGEDVIGYESSPGKIYSSHRIFSNMTHNGDGYFGAATGREVNVRTIADCVCVANKIVHEWLVRDQAAIVSQTGQDPSTFALEKAREAIASGQAQPTSEELLKRWVGLPDPGEPPELVAGLVESYRGIWEQSSLGNLDKTHDRGCEAHVPGNRLLHGRLKLSQWFTGYISAFPMGKFTLNHWILNEEAGKNTRVALRWSYVAEHAGIGAFGRPTGAPVVILAITHAELQAGQVVREYTLIDELALWGQIHHHVLASSTQ